MWCRNQSLGHFIIQFIVLVSQLQIFAAATCHKYTPSSSFAKQLRFPKSFGEWMQISKPLQCPAGKNPKFYGCSGGSKKTGTQLGCTIGADGAAVVLGTVNLTMSTSEKSALFDLVRASMPKHLEFYHIYDRLEGCLNGKNDIQTDYQGCVLAGKVGYLAAAAEIYCTDGTVSDCSKDGSLKNGTAVKICGSRRYGGHGQNQILSLSTKLVHINASDIHKYENYTAIDAKSKALCKKLVNKGAKDLVVSWTSVTMATALSLGYALFA